MVTVVPTTQGSIEVMVGLKGLVAPEKEISRIDRELKKLEKEIVAQQKKLENKGFVDRAPPAVIDEARAQLGSMSEARERLLESKTLAEEL